MVKKAAAIILRILAMTFLCGIAVVVIHFASTRSLPFLPENEQDYSVISVPENEYSESDGSGDGSESDMSTVSGDGTYEADRLKAFLEQCEKTVPSETEGRLSSEMYDSAKHKILLLDDISSLGSMENVSVDVRMGYIFLNDGRIFSSSLTDITSLLEGYKFIGERDKERNPIFEKDGKYYFLDSLYVIQPSDYDPMIDSGGFDFDIPSYHGVQSFSDVKLTYNDKGKHGAYSIDGKTSYAYNRFEKSFNFYGFYLLDRECGIGCVIKKDDKTGVETLEFYSSVFYKVDTTSSKLTNNVAQGLYPPEDRGLYSIGFFYFDNGYTRVRNKEGDSFKEMLMDIDGNLIVPIKDFEIKSYSDGMILLEKNGVYGYMASTMSWATDPVYTDAKPFFEGLAVVQSKNGKYGVIDRNGITVIPDVFDSISVCSGGVISAYSAQDGWSFFVKTTVENEQ